MRRKTVDFDGAKFTIAALSMVQVEEYLAKSKDVDFSDKNKRLDKDAERLNAELVCMSLNRAEQKNDAPSPDDKELWTLERIRHEMDSRLFYELLPNAIREFSGLKLVPRETSVGADAPKLSDQPGEAKATSVN